MTLASATSARDRAWAASLRVGGKPWTSPSWQAVPHLRATRGGRGAAGPAGLALPAATTSLWSLSMRRSRIVASTRAGPLGATGRVSVETPFGRSAARVTVATPRAAAVFNAASARRCHRSKASVAQSEEWEEKPGRAPPQSSAAAARSAASPREGARAHS